MRLDTSAAQAVGVFIRLGFVVKYFFTFLRQLNASKYFCLALFLVFYSFNAHAATQGAPGTTSTGTVGIQVVNNDLAWIKGLDDINLGSWSGTGDMSGNDDVCVATNFFFFALNNYAIRASGDGDASDPSAFTLSNGVDDIYYRVFWTDTNTQVELLPGQLMTGRQYFANFGYLANLFAGPAGCPNPNANVEVRIEEAQLASGSGTHSGILVLELIPE